MKSGTRTMREVINGLFAKFGTILGTETEPREELILPEPARTLWLETHAIIERTFAQTGGCRLGGGTLLSARWKHRVSLDIDLTIEPKGRQPQRIEHLIREESAFLRDLKRLGCGEPTAPSAHQIRIPFKDSMLDISVLDAQPRAGERQATVNGKRGVVLSTTQVLGGKLARPEQLLHRDAYDIRYAGEVDKQSLAKAINGIDRRDAEKIVATWNKLDGRWSAMAPGQLRKLVPKHSYDPATLAAETAQALRNALYQRVRITTRGREGTFYAETVDNTTVRVAFTRRTLEKTFDEHGINDYLRAQATGADDDEILRRVKKACRFGAKPRTVYESTHEAPALETAQARTKGPANGGWPARPAISLGPAVKKDARRNRDNSSRGRR